MPALAADLVRRQVAVIAAIGAPMSAFAAKAATTTIPIVFIAGEDPVRLGLVASLARPGGNLTGINFFSDSGKAAGVSARAGARSHSRCCARQSGQSFCRTTLKDVETAARAMGLQTPGRERQHRRRDRRGFRDLRATAPTRFSSAAAAFSRAGVSIGPLGGAPRDPRDFRRRDFAEAGGLMSYGASLIDAYRQVGVYAGRILKGDKPADLPVVQSTKFELVINLQTARMLGLTVPPTLLASADEVIE